MNPALSFADVTRVYGNPRTGRLALDGVSFDVQPGETVSIVGRSGSGKSTLLHLAAGIDLPTGGVVSVAGKVLSRMSDAQRAALRRDEIGLVFQFFHLLPHLSVAENVSLPQMIAGRAGAAANIRSLELLDAVGLADRASDAASDLSGGEMQRVAICRALVRSPTLILADEPTGNLDEANADSVMRLLLRLVAERNSTLVYVTHDRDFADLADRRWEIHDGRLEADRI